jgi:hypothetical protein
LKSNYSTHQISGTIQMANKQLEARDKDIAYWKERAENS